jgi:phospholipid-binding lipoprotein MlaA
MKTRSIIRVAFLAIAVATASGCAALSDGLSPDTGTALAGLDSSPVETIKADLGTLDQPRIADADSIATPPEFIAQASESRPAEPTHDTQDGAKAAEPSDEFYDPFAKKEEALAAGEDYDPWEGFNSVMFEFNRKFDKYLLKPVAQVYEKIMPDELEKGISNFMHNARVGPRLINNILQLKIKGAGIEIGRLLINSTIGIAGFFDPAKNWFDLTTPDEDTGQTLGAFGVPPGPYLVLPLLPPLTLRDFFGLLLDFGADPVNYFVFPTFEVDDLPSLIAHKNRDTTTIAQFGTRVEEIVNYRSLNLEKFQGVEEATVDLYSAVRNAYLQQRAKAIRE